MAIKYKWLVEQLREIISDSIQKGINKLPTEQELAVRYRVSRQTVRAALAVLEDEREIRRIKGSGAYITGLSSLEDRNIVGILIPDEQQYEYPALINDIRVALAAEGFSCKVYPTHNHVRPGTANPSVSFEKSAAGTYCGACKKRLTIT